MSLGMIGVRYFGRCSCGRQVRTVLDRAEIQQSPPTVWIRCAACGAVVPADRRKEGDE